MHRHRRYRRRVRARADRPLRDCRCKARGATTIIAVDTLPERLAMAKRMGADIALDYRKTNVVDEIKRLTDGRGATSRSKRSARSRRLKAAVACLKPGGVLSLGVYSGKLTLPLDAFAAGLVRDAAGAIVGALAMARDCTERYLAEKARASGNVPAERTTRSP